MIDPNRVRRFIMVLLEGFLLSFFHGQIAEKIEDGVVLQVLEFARIEEGTATNGAKLKPDVRLVGVDHPNHLAGAARTMDAIHFVEGTTCLRVANVNRIGAAHLLQLILFELVEEDALTIGASIHFHASKIHLYHR
jgi:hypothetical protein